MNKLEVREYVESESIDMFSEMNKKKATPFYHQLKGSFLSALAAVDLEEKESEVDDENKNNVLDIVEQLSNDLAATEEEDTNDQTGAVEDTEDETSEEEETSEETTDEEATDETEENSEESAEDEVDAEATDEEQAEATDEEETTDEDEDEDADEADKAQGQESPHAKDRDSNFAKPTLKAEKPAKRDVDHTRDSVDAADNIQEGEAELSEAHRALELHAAGLESQVSALQEENTRLKQALHRTLVERVVDTKIAVGIVPASERNEKIAEHSDRTASSLADSLRDLASMTHKVVVPEAIENKSAAVEEDSTAVVDNGFSHEDKVEESGLDAETLFTDVLMGRRAL